MVGQTNQMGLSLTKVVQDLHKITEALEALADGSNSDDMSAILALAPQLDTAIEKVKESVDSRINFLEFVKLLEQKYKDDIAFFQSKLKMIQAFQDKIKEQTVFVIQNNPDISFEGTHKKLAVQKNGGAQSIDWKVQLQDMKHVVDPTDISKFPESMVSEVKLFVLDKKKFEAYLSSGGQSEAAELLPRGVHLRIK